MINRVMFVSLLDQARQLGLLALIGISLFADAAVRAQQFSADLVTTRQDGSTISAGKLRVLQNKVRLETAELADGFFLIDGAEPFAYFIRPAMRVYMDARQSSRLTQWFIPIDPVDPCRQWQKMANSAGVGDRGEWRCEQVGQEAIDGRDVMTFRVGSARGQEFVGWVNPAYRFPLQIRTEDGVTVGLRDIRDEAQPVALFEVPPGFRRFDPQILIRQIKQSDVWVADQKDRKPSSP